jgi:hypothetical protein
MNKRRLIGRGIHHLYESIHDRTVRFGAVKWQVVIGNLTGFRRRGLIVEIRWAP